MVSTTVFSKTLLERLRLWLMLLVFVPAVSCAAEIEIANQQLALSEDGYALAADFNFELNPRLEEAINKGVMLHFVVDFELSRPRWYFLDEKLVSRNQTFRLSYHALTRQYRMSTGVLHQSFVSLSEALRMLSRLRNWTVIDKADKNVKPGETYQAAVRLRLDITQLPRPFQITALGNKDWSFNSDWKLWPATLPSPVAVPAVAAPAPVAAEAK